MVLLLCYICHDWCILCIKYYLDLVNVYFYILCLSKHLYGVHSIIYLSYVWEDLPMFVFYIFYIHVLYIAAALFL